MKIETSPTVTIKTYQSFFGKAITRRLAGLTAAVGLVALAAGTFADPPTTMAPPLSTTTAGGSLSGTGQDSVFQWQEVPQNQQVPLRRAVFDQGGYQLYDTAGETIVVPFADQNLYVMKFAPSPDGTTYFVNTGDAPVLYIPQGGFLENASAPGARWYPFPKDFRPTQPVYLGLAPSYPEFIGMGWYPDMVYYGGYYGYHPFLAGSMFLPTLGLSFFIGGHPYYGWPAYHHYFYSHPAPYRVTIINRNIYRVGGRSFGTFRGAGHPYQVTRPFGGHAFGSGHVFSGARSFNGAVGHTPYAHHAFGGSRTFQGAHAVPGGHSFSGNHSFGGSHSFGGVHAAPRSVGAGHAVGGGHGGGFGGRR